MGRKPIEINPECGKRLLTWLRHIEMSQGELANITGYTQQHISGIVTGKKNLTYDMACAISSGTRQNNLSGGAVCVRPEWLLCSDNKGMTNIDALDAALDQMANTAALYNQVFKTVAENEGFSYRPIFRESLPDYITTNDEACFGIIKDSFVVGLLSLEDAAQFRKELAHYAEFLFNKMLSKSGKNIIEDFPAPKEALNG